MCDRGQEEGKWKNIDHREKLVKMKVVFLKDE